VPGLLAAAISVTSSLLQAGPMGAYSQVDEAGGWNPDVAFDPDHDLYLVVWTGASHPASLVNRRWRAGGQHVFPSPTGWVAPASPPSRSTPASASSW